MNAAVALLLFGVATRAVTKSRSVFAIACGNETASSPGEDDAGDGASPDGSRRTGSGSTDDPDPTSDKDSGAKKDSGFKDSGKDSSDADADDADTGDADAGDADTDAGTDSGDADTGDTGTDADGGSSTPPVVWVNEVLSDPPGTDGNNEFVELGCGAAAALDQFWFVIVDGDVVNADPNNVGMVTFKKKLTGITCGSNGLVILQRGSVYDGVGGTAYVDDFFTDNIQNGTQTYWLVKTDTFDATDIDQDNDGVIDDGVLASNIVDSVTASDGTDGDRAYSPVVLTSAGLQALSRFAGAFSASASSWYYGAVKGPSPFTYDTADVSANFPAGGTLSPGEQNSSP